MDEVVLREGGCHCGAVRFRVRYAEKRVLECNCSVCTRKGFLHLIVPAEDFELLGGDDVLSTYTFGTHVARHLFCSVCGIHAFYVPRSHPEGFDVNARCLDDWQPGELEVVPFDGRNWEDSVRELPGR